MTPSLWTMVGLGGPVWLYLVARLISSAYFRSKQDYERRLTHE